MTDSDLLVSQYDGPPPFIEGIPTGYCIAIGHGAARSHMQGEYVIVIGNGRDVPEPIISNYVNLFGVVVVRDAPRLARSLYKLAWWTLHRYPSLPMKIYRWLGPPPRAMRTITIPDINDIPRE